MAYSPTEEAFLSRLTAVQFPDQPLEGETAPSVDGMQLAAGPSQTASDAGNGMGEIKPIPRNKAQEALGFVGEMLTKAGVQLDQYGLDVPGLGRITLKDLTVGDAGKVLEDMSYGFYPVKGGNAATGGIGTYGLKADPALELMNVAPAAGAVAKAGVKGAEKVGRIAGEELSRAIIDGTGSMAKVVPQSARPKFIVEPGQAMRTNVPVKMPADPVFAEAVGNTPGAQITEEGLLMNVVRFQKPEQEGAQAIRTGVFYLPSGSANTRHYKTGATGYGGTEKFEGQTLIRSPLFVKGATGGKAPEAAYDAIKGKGAMKALDKAVMDTVTSRGWMNKMEDGLFEEKVQQFLIDHGGNPDLAWEIIQNSKKGNQLRYALQENIIAHTVREAGHDAVIGYSKGKAGASISEVFDVREQTFPARGMEPQIHDAFTQ